MNNEKNSQPVDLDSLIGDNHLQMMKAALPDMSVTEQRFISLFVKFNELRRTVKLFEDEEVAAMGICSTGEDTEKPASPIDMLGAIKPFGTPTEQDLIDLIMNFFQGFKLAGAVSDAVPGSMVPDPEPTENTARQAQSQTPPPHRSGGPFGRMSFDQIKNFIPQEQQSRLETMQLMMSAMQQMN